MDEKVSKDSFKAYRDWQRYILKTKPKLSPKIRRVTLIAYCLAMASHGTNGLGCYAGDGTVAEELGMYDSKAVRPYRHEAMCLGWFVWNGERRGRAKVLDIAIPADDETSVRTEVPADDGSLLASADGHVSGAYESDCPGRQEYLRKVALAGAVGYVPTWQIHEEATSR
jgi:hypothetical protein